MKYENQEMIDKIDGIAKQLLEEKKSNKYRDRFFPQMIDKLNYKAGAEVGVDKGGFSAHILSRSKIDKYFCIDTWQDDFGSDYKKDYFAKDGNVRYTEAQTALQAYINADRTKMLRMTGNEASHNFANECLDFVYIDGDHSLEGIYTDIKAWITKVKVGGIIAGHDYKDGMKSGITDYFGNQLDFKIKTVVDYYCQRYGHKLNIVGGRILSWWFVKNNKTEDHVNIHLIRPAQE